MDSNNNSDNSSTQVHENKLGSTIIPFNYKLVINLVYSNENYQNFFLFEKIDIS